MGCFPQKPIKQARGPQNKTQINEIWNSNPRIRSQVTPNKTICSQKLPQRNQPYANNGSYIYIGNDYNFDQNVKDSNQDMINKYRIVVKQTFYKTNSIHTFNYQPLLTFNPPGDAFLTIERDILDKTYNLNLSREQSSHSKLLLSKK